MFFCSARQTTPAGFLPAMEDNEAERKSDRFFKGVIPSQYEIYGNIGTAERACGT
jgi:hypothetical protein